MQVYKNGVIKTIDHSRKLFVGKALAVASLCAMLLWAFSGGPDPRKTGAPGDGTCVASGCHVGTPLNGGGGKIQLSFSSTNYTPGGSPVPATLTIAASVAKAYGFHTGSRPSSNTT